MTPRLLILLVILCLAAFVSCLVGIVDCGPGDLLKVLTNRESEGLEDVSKIVWQMRLPRIALALLVGGALAASGAGYQGLFRNPLADPFVIGASSGAALGAAIALTGYLNGFNLGTWGIAAAALVGALMAVGLVYLIASVGGNAPTLSLLLAGVAVSSLLGAVVSLLMFLNNDRLLSVFGWMMGSFAGTSWPDVHAAWPLIAFGCFSLWLLSRPLDTLTLGEEAAASLGLRLGLVRAAIVLAASLTTAAAVAAGGIIGFVGLIGPHIARMFVGARHVYLIPASCLVGATLMIAADIVARSILAPIEVPAAIVTALLGSPFFLIMLRTHQRQLGFGK